MKTNKSLTEETKSHEIINFRCPASLKIEFEYQCAKEERTLSQQLRVLMAEYVAKMDDRKPTAKEIKSAEENHSDSVIRKFVEQQKKNKRGR